MTDPIVHGTFRVASLLERIEETSRGQSVSYKFIARGETGKKLIVLSGELFAALVVGDALRVHFDKVAVSV